MGALVFDKCCGCIELRTGSLIIGYINLIGTIILTVLMAIAVIGGSVVVSQTDGSGSDKDHAMMAGGIFLIVVAGLALLFLILFLAFGIVLLVGLHQNKAGHVKAYLIFAVIFMVLWCIQFLVTAITAPNAGQIVRDLISILLNIYFLLVIRSQYFAMKDTRGGPAIYSAA